MENVRFKDHFLISGLTGPKLGLGTRDWQQQVKGHVQEKLQLWLGCHAPIAYFQNATGARKDGIKSFPVKTQPSVAT